MSGSSDQMKVQMAPLMSDLQRQVLDSYLKTAALQMNGFTLGSPYGGASEKSYTPKQFNMVPGTPRYTDPWATGGSGPKPGDDNGGNDDNDRDKRGGKDKRRTPGRNGPGGRRGESQSSAFSQGAGPSNPGFGASVSPWASILRNMPANSNVPQAMPNDQRLTQLLTSVFARPSTYAQTGNYPKY